MEMEINKKSKRSVNFNKKVFVSVHALLDEK